MPPKKKRGRDAVCAGVDENGEEIYGNGEGRQSRFTTISFTVNCPLDAELFPFELLDGIFQQWTAASEKEIVLQGEKYTIATPMRQTNVLVHYAWQWERGENNGRLHIQGCAAFSTRLYLTVIIKLFALLPEYDGKKLHPHIEAVKGPYLSIVEYCTKRNGDPRWPGHGGRVDGTEPSVWGVNGSDTVANVGQGHRTDIEDLHHQIVSVGANVQDLLLDPVYGPPLGRNLNWALAVQGARDRKITEGSDTPRTIYTFFGETGTNKTRRVFLETKKKYGNYSNLYIHSLSGKFWDGYTGQKDILLDEVSYESLKRSSIDISTMLRILDRYQVRVEVKGGVQWLTNDRVFITSNEEPTEWYPQCSKSHKDALYRRLNGAGCVLEHFLVPWEPPGGWET